MADEKLIPDPPRKQFPSLPDDMRWRIEAPSKSKRFDTAHHLRRVHLETRVHRSFLWKKTSSWESILWSSWNTRNGLGDFSRATPKSWHLTSGLASTMGFILNQYAESMKQEDNNFDYVQGVSKA